MKRIALMAVGLLLVAAAAFAQVGPKYSIWDVGHRTTASVQAGGMFMTQMGDYPNTGAIDAGGAVTYSWHERFSTYVLYNHGFPVRSLDPHTNFLRAAANMLVYPGPEALPGKLRVFVGMGGLWLGRDDIKQWKGYESHLTGSWMFSDRLAAYGTYSHAFAVDKAQTDYDFARAGLTAKLWP